MDTRVQETRVRLSDSFGRGVIHEDDLAWFTLCQAGQGVEQAVETRCLQIGIVEYDGPPCGSKAAGAIREEEHFAGVGNGSDAHGVRTVPVDELLEELGAYPTKPDDGDVEGMLTTESAHGGRGCVCRQVGYLILKMAQ